MGQPAMSPTMRPALPTMSVGHSAAGHKIEDKLRAIASAGFVGVEIFWACLEELAERSSGAARAEKLHHAAKTTRELCDELSLEVIALQPVMDYDGIIDER